MDFGFFLKNERIKHNWTQTEFGAKIGINTCAISRIENGLQSFSASKLNKLAELFLIDIKYIRDLFYANKFVKEAELNNCTNSVFLVAYKNFSTKKSI